jgi:hypothetical protein
MSFLQHQRITAAALALVKYGSVQQIDPALRVGYPLRELNAGDFSTGYLYIEETKSVARILVLSVDLRSGPAFEDRAAFSWPEIAGEEIRIGSTGHLVAGSHTLGRSWAV